MDEQETLIWEGHPSQWTHFTLYAICVLLCWLIVPVFVALWRWLETSRHVYRVTSERVIITQGVLTRRTTQLELYRAKDASLLEPFWLRLAKLGHIDLVTSDQTLPFLRLQAVPNAAALREKLRNAIERLRVRKGIRELDIGEVRH
ncbi:MAG: PH domain-containing protein [Stenotrophobium sp.]